MRNRLDVTMVKAHNRRLVFEDVVASAPTTRAQIVANTNLSAGTVATFLDDLSRRGIIREVKEARRSSGPAVGRKPNRVEFLPKARRIICIDLATKHPTYYIKDLLLSTESVGHRVDTSSDATYEERLRRLLKEIVRQVRPANDSDGDAGRPIIGVGISVPGPYRPAEDRVSCKLVPELNDIHLRSLIREYLPFPVQIDHDVKLALGTEVKSIAYHEYKTILSLYFGEGVGSAISINGRVFGGAHEFAGEIGQMNVTGGGTLEQGIAWSVFLEEAGLPRALVEGENEAVLNAELQRRYLSGDPAFNESLARMIRIMAAAIANVICVINPHAVIISGNYSLFGDRFVKELQLSTEEHLIEEMTRDLIFTRSSSQGNPAMIGAGAVVREYWLENEDTEGESPPPRNGIEAGNSDKEGAK
ncbi:MAG TPA: ROK family protein [Spirochaetia bacterium]|nr:ROK family protein [Spirochaetia bacterium]